MNLHDCENCRIRAYSERKPHSIIARIWKWHTKWCPLLKAHERKLAKKLDVICTSKVCPGTEEKMGDVSGD